MPAGIFPHIVFIVALDTGTDSAVHLAVFVVSGYAHKICKLGSILRDIEPEADTYGIFQLDGFSIPNERVSCPKFRTVKGFVHRIAESKRLTAAMNLSRFRCNNLQLRNGILILICANRVAQPPVIQICAFCTGFKIEDDLGALAKRHGNGISDVAADESSRNDRFLSAFRSGKFAVIDGSYRFICYAERNVAILEQDVMETVLCYDLKSDGSAKGDHHLIASECDRFRNNDVNRGRSNDFTVYEKRYDRIADRSVGNEYAVFNATVGRAPDCIFRNRGCRTGRADARCAYFNLGTCGNVFVRCGNRCIGESIRRGRRGIHNETVGNRTFGTVGGLAGNLNVVAAGRTGNVGGRAAAVKAKNISTACFIHNFNGFFPVRTRRTAGSIAVRGHKYDLIVSGNTNEGARIATVVQITVAVIRAVDTVLSDKLEAADRFLCRTVSGNRFIPVCVVRAAKSGSILKDGKPRGVTCLGNAEACNTVRNVRARGDAGAGVIAVTVHTRNDRVIRYVVCRIVGIAVLFNHRCSLLGHFCHTANRALRILVGRVNTYVIAVNVRNRDIVVDELAICSVTAVDGLRDAGRERGFHRLIR